MQMSLNGDLPTVKQEKKKNCQENVIEQKANTMQSNEDHDQFNWAHDL